MSEGSADHILLAMVARELGVDAFNLAYLPFSGGGPAAEAVLDGRARAGISNWSEFAPHIEAGRMRPLALSGDARLVGVDVPTLREGGLDVVLHNWNGVFAPPGIEERHRARLDALVEAMARSPAWEREAAQRRWRLLYLPRREFEPFLRTEMRSVEATLARLGLGQSKRSGRLTANRQGSLVHLSRPALSRLAASLALAEKRVLLVDVDPQGNLTSGVGMKDQAS